jgi:antitoxin HigA-1
MARIQTHPGEIIKFEYLEPMGLSATTLATAIDVPANRLTDIIRGRRGISADTAMRLARYFKTDPRFWMNLQAAHDLSKAQAAHDYSKLPEHT